MFLFVMVAAVWPDFFGRSALIVSGNAVETVNNIMASQQLFRIGIASELIEYASVVLLGLALYILLKPVDKNLALLALFWRFGEAFILGFNTLHSYIVLMLLGDVDYVTVFQTDQLHALVQLFIDAQGTELFIGITFLCLGSTVFNYLFFKSRYIPRILALGGYLHL